MSFSLIIIFVNYIHLFLQSYLLSTCIRLVNRNGRFWKVEFAFQGNPVSSRNANRNMRQSNSLQFVYDMGNTSESTVSTVKSIVQEWAQMAHLFELVSGLEKHLRSDASHVASFVSINRYDFKEVTLEYGPGRKQLARVRWSMPDSCFRLSFGGVDDLAGSCPHSLVREQLEHHLNRHRDLALTLKIMHETYAPLASLCRLPRTPQMGVNTSKVNQPVETFVLLPQSPTHVKVAFYNTYCLDVHMKAGGLVFVRDGAISLFDQRKVMDETQPIPVSH